jgi:hypothetical protein
MPARHLRRSHRWAPFSSVIGSPREELRASGFVKGFDNFWRMVYR